MVDGQIEECPITYEELADLENEFEEVENEMMRQQYAHTKPLFAKREKVISQIPNFWALVFEQAPPDVDQYIQPTDSAVLLSSLKNISVTRFELEKDPKNGDPRSVKIALEFGDNEYFEDKVLEKTFWYRYAKEGWEGLVSEPVPIKWKAGKDLTEGILDLTLKVWENDKKNPAQANGKDKPKKEADYTADEKALKAKIDETGIGGGSLFNWFGYRGFNVSEEESKAAFTKQQSERAERAAGKKTEKDEKMEEDDDDDDDDEDPLGLEIFPDGDELAVAIAEDLYPEAIKYFINGQEAAELSELDFEEIDDDDEDDEMDDDDTPANKKRKA